ncbi:hybrid-cluster NAD(P)-dependent oxidoreductase [Hahella sp. CCB-MM4]|uniref:hybrid-cluster NAD(P)-dependent oxidoreductase n=1 Tax=Hahella sp. (strain CCB-MM4) TaxID=1926491 RepID=UPI000B9C41C4|nr:hybrid-cluster NAD(P)-dependent oxidoreductase [Hahella sp. CCB-MM4]OZG70071.1 hybrid-cluster NAD(P)-dependent oxidoreductase [Hahella sp. CCB-MM4]
MSSEIQDSHTQYFNDVNTRVWANGRHVVRCVRVIQETWDVKTFCFNAEQSVMFFFKPGQFVTLELDIEGEQVMRSYTISSSPSVPYSFSITVKRVPGGRVSNWLHDNLKVQDELAVHGPVGNFNCIDFPDEKVLFLSGGVGVTPVMSMARWYFDTNADVDMVFVHSARSPKDIIFERELWHMSSRVPNFALHVICERTEIGHAWPGYRGYLDQSKLDMIVPDFLTRRIFCCGPTPYMRAVRELLKANGYDMSRYHEESFGATPDQITQDALEQAEIAVKEAEEIKDADMYTVEFLSSGMSIQATPGETVHAAASRLGLNIPKACGVGICGTCKVMKTSGEVEMQHNGGITDEDIEEGYILSCCSIPRTNVSVES